jgi:hypothetical protein
LKTRKGNFRQGEKFFRQKVFSRFFLSFSTLRTKRSDANCRIELGRAVAPASSVTAASAVVGWSVFSKWKNKIVFKTHKATRGVVNICNAIVATYDRKIGARNVVEKRPKCSKIWYIFPKWRNFIQSGHAAHFRKF